MSNSSFFMFSATTIIFDLAIIVLLIVALWKIFEKAGKPGWAVLIPFYNFVVLLEIVKKPIWWIIWLFVPIANIVIVVWVTNLLSKSFGKNEGFTLGLLFLSVIFYPILAFGNAKYNGLASSNKTTIEV